MRVYWPIDDDAKQPASAPKPAPVAPRPIIVPGCRIPCDDCMYQFDCPKLRALEKPR